MVDEPDELDAISILRGLKEKYENQRMEEKGKRRGNLWSY